MSGLIRQDDSTGSTVATETISAEHFQKVIIAKTATGAAISPLTDTELRTTAVSVSLGAETTKVIGTVNISAGQTVTASGPLTDTQLRLTAVPVSLSTMPKIPTTFKTLKAVTITTIATVWTPATGKKFRLMGGCISVSVAASVLFEDNSAGTDIYQSPLLLAATPYNFDLGDGVLSAAINNVLKATASAAGTISGTLYGLEE
jgi:hypothetical protein